MNKTLTIIGDSYDDCMTIHNNSKNIKIDVIIDRTGQSFRISKKVFKEFINGKQGGL